MQAQSLLRLEEMDDAADESDEDYYDEEKESPSKGEEVKQPPTKPSPVKASPVKASPAKPSPVKASPAKTSPVKRRESPSCSSSK